MATLEEVFSAEASETQREDGTGVTLPRAVEVDDWRKPNNNGQLALMEKAQEFFRICDREEKGFINRTDLQHLQAELCLSSDDLQDVFDSLDSDGNGSLTLEEFTTGFSQFLFGEKGVVEKVNKYQDESGTVYENRHSQQSAAVDDEEHHFHSLMDGLGARNLLKDQREIRNLWTQLRKDDPHLLTNFEDILVKVSTRIQEANEEKQMMEFVLKRKAAEYGEEIKLLENEMEQQIRSEKDRMFNQDLEAKSQWQEVEYLLRAKEREQEQLIEKQNRLERQCVELQNEKQESKLENQRLKQMNEQLEKDLQKANDDLLYAQHQVLALEEETCQLHKDREMELYRVTEGLEREKLALCKQLDLLREMNKHLRAERDLSLAGFQKPPAPRSSSLWNQRMANTDQHTGTRMLSNRKGDDCEELGNSESSSKNSERADGCSHTHKGMDKEAMDKTRQRQYLQRIISIEEDPLPQFLEMPPTIQLKNWMEVEEEKEELVRETDSVEMGKVPSPLGRELAGKGAFERESRPNPDRLFKIIFIGNSSVGKSSVLRRFCGDNFCPGMCATVGIDYHVKTVNVDNCHIALQLWDTAGQERFRSITKQFFRKADGVVLIYDITAAVTFYAVRQWLQSVQEGAGPEVLILLLANKTDLQDERQVTSEEGQRLAKECNLIFYECSAFSGVNITESMIHLARILKREEGQVITAAAAQYLLSPSTFILLNEAGVIGYTTGRILKSAVGQKALGVELDKDIVIKPKSFYFLDSLTDTGEQSAVAPRLLKEVEDKEKEKIIELREDSPQQKTCCAK